jgi:hypothetical protein
MRPTEFGSVSAVQWSELVGEWVRELLRFSPCELLLLEAGSWSTWLVRKSRVRGSSAVGSRYQTTVENTADWEDIVRAVVNCRVCELAKALYLLVVTICKCSINPITNPNPVFSHPYTCICVLICVCVGGGALVLPMFNPRVLISDSFRCRFLLQKSVMTDASLNQTYYVSYWLLSSGNCYANFEECH